MGLKGIDMSLSYSEVYIEIFAIIEMSRDKLCSHGLLVLETKRIEMGLNGVEMS